ncbi:MAG: 16S rRNA (adenine(1518)-N(6)/adenine(1519)-N(6))-dimethyltransferase RsmA [Candidatus Promineifilaceae bacterium]|nr:16S rRNA (adenine(1518)-N(6)/adenine(1519)-N(6))-dimethyltransferase RsmA [Candidatus Promineifilaceae bacterium]
MAHPKAILRQFGIKPKKSLGQNFLFDDNILSQIVGAASVQPEDEVLEIGAGLGHLTGHLANAARRVVALEIDQRLMPPLRLQLAEYKNVVLVNTDVLSMDPSTYFPADYIVVANIPYYISGAILRHLLTKRPRPMRMVLTVQEEVADRLAAEPGELSLLAVSVQYYGTVSRLVKIRAGAFWPSPNINSTVVRIDVNEKLPLPDAEEAAFFRLVKVGFAQKRKQLQKNLRVFGSSRRRIYQALERAKIDPRRRPQSLSVTEWLALYQSLKAENVLQ